MQVLSLSSAKPLENAIVRISDSQQKIAVIASSDGLFNLRKFYGQNYQAVIEAPGYVSRALSLTGLYAAKKVFLVDQGAVGFVLNSLSSVGDRVDICVQSDVEWTCQIYRCGLSKRNVYESDKMSPVYQKLPDSFATGVGLEWDATISVDGGRFTEPGLYAVQLQDAYGKSTCFPLVINSREIVNEVCVVANTSTWHMYNCWGGRSRYRNFELNWATGQQKATFLSRFRGAVMRRLLRLFKGVHREERTFFLEPSWITKRLSLKRPMLNKALSSTSPEEKYLDHLAGHEWRFLSWLESNGFKYDYLQDNHLSMFGGRLSEYKNIVLVGHSEYWTKEDYNALQCAYDKGCNILNLSGNSLYQRVVYDESGFVRAVRKGFKSKDHVGLIADLFSTDLSIKSFSGFMVRLQGDQDGGDGTGAQPGVILNEEDKKIQRLPASRIILRCYAGGSSAVATSFTVTARDNVWPSVLISFTDHLPRDRSNAPASLRDKITWCGEI